MAPLPRNGVRGASAHDVPGPKGRFAPWRVMDPAGSHGAALETHMHRWTRGGLLAAAALLLGTSPALAGTTLAPSALALPRVDLGRAAPAEAIGAPLTLALASAPVPAIIQLDAVRYQPMQPQQFNDSGSDRPIVSQLHGGY